MQSSISVSTLDPTHERHDAGTSWSAVACRAAALAGLASRQPGLTASVDVERDAPPEPSKARYACLLVPADCARAVGRRCPAPAAAGVPGEAASRLDREPAPAPATCDTTEAEMHLEHAARDSRSWATEARSEAFSSFREAILICAAAACRRSGACGRDERALRDEHAYASCPRRARACILDSERMSVCTRLCNAPSCSWTLLHCSCETAEYRMAGPPSSEQLTESRPNSYSPCFFPPAETARPLLEPSTPGCPARS